MIFTILSYLCIAITFILSFGIIIALFKLTFISKIFFLLALILMIIVSYTSLINIEKNNSIQYKINYVLYLENKSIINYKSAIILIILSTILMFVNYLIYTLYV